MCGLTGFIDFKNKTKPETLELMVSTLGHRGPDSSGTQIFTTDFGTVALGHTRLSIIDLSLAGNQPMNKSNFSIVFNGEIYNYRKLKSELTGLGHTFQSNSDTEIILESYKRWGRECVKKFIGMFAFVIYDKEKSEVLLCRDRTGIKPLFYYYQDNLFMFGSELKPFHKHSSFEKKINNASVYLYMQYGYVPGPETIFEDTYKLEPGHWLIIDLKKASINTEKYWDVRDYYKMPLLDIDYPEAVKHSEELIFSSCHYRMLADVPVGIFLSGGYDSTLITAILQQNSAQKIRTFTIGFPDGVDESPYAEKVSKILGTDHVTYHCSFNDAKEIIPQLSYYYDEPNADISCIPTMLVSRLARSDVKVALSADGGDEVFAGYSGYTKHMYRAEKFQKIPQFIASGLGIALDLGNLFIPQEKARLRHKNESIANLLKSKSHQRLSMLVETSQQIPEYFYRNLLKKTNKERIAIFKEDFSTVNDPMAVMLLIDYLTSLRDLLLVKVDRATMSVSLEGREPLLDHRIIEFAARLPMHYKCDGNDLKKILKDITHKYIDKSIMDRPKTGFDLPIYEWLKNDLKYIVEEYLNKKAIEESGFFNYTFVKKILDDFDKGNLRYNQIIWRMLVFQMWYKKWIN